MVDVVDGEVKVAVGVKRGDESVVLSVLVVDRGRINGVDELDFGEWADWVE